MRNILVTGANGFIGRALCRKMLSEGWHVRGSVRSIKSKVLLDKSVDTIAMGALGPDTEWNSALSGIDTVVHLAAKVHQIPKGAADSTADHRYVNFAGTKRLAQIAATKRVQRFIYLSTVKVNGEGRSAAYTEEDVPLPSDPYGISKWEAEQFIQKIAAETGMEFVILRPPLVYGPNVKANFLQLIKLVNKGIPLPFASIKNHRSLIYIDNLIDAIITCAIHPDAVGKRYLISDGQDTSTPELIQRISSALGKPVRIFPFPPYLLRFILKIIGKSESVAKLLNSLTVDSSKIRNELNWSPGFTMEEGLAETAKWFRQKREADPILAI